MPHSVPVVEVRPVDDDLLHLALDVSGTLLAAAYVHAGQFVTLSTAGSPPGFFAMASAPGRERFEFLIRIERHKPKTASLGALSRGDYVEVGDVQGRGYPLAEQAGRNLLFVAAGTGIAPIRASLAEILRSPQAFGEIILMYGAANRAALAFADEHDRWRAAGVHFVPCLSRPDADWRGAVGYVQDVLPTLPLAPASTTAFLCGPQAMTKPVAALLAARGVPTDRIFKNS